MVAVLKFPHHPDFVEGEIDAHLRELGLVIHFNGMLLTSGKLFVETDFALSSLADHSDFFEVLFDGGVFDDTESLERFK